MNSLLPSLAQAAQPPPDILGPLDMREPSFWGSPWGLLTMAVLAGALTGAVLVLAMNRRQRQGRTDARQKLRARLAALHDADPTLLPALVASILRQAIALRYDVPAASRTGRELETLLDDRPDRADAAPALTLLKDCETARFGGAQVESAVLAERAEAAVSTLLGPVSAGSGRKAR